MVLLNVLVNMDIYNEATLQFYLVVIWLHLN